MSAQQYIFTEIYQSGVFLPILAYFGLPLSRKFRFLDAAFNSRSLCRWR